MVNIPFGHNAYANIGNVFMVDWCMFVCICVRVCALIVKIDFTFCLLAFTADYQMRKCEQMVIQLYITRSCKGVGLLSTSEFH